MTIYRYGPIAWFWRALMIPAAVGGLLLMASGAAAGLFVALPLVVPVLFFGMVVAVRIDRSADGQLHVRTLLGRRQIPHGRLGPATARQTYHGDLAVPMYAPRLWVKVHGGLPIYVDLQGDIPDRQTFATTFRLAGVSLPR